MFRILWATQPELTRIMLHEKLTKNGYRKAADLINFSVCEFVSDIQPTDFITLSNELLNEGTDFPTVLGLATSLGMSNRELSSIKKAQQAMNCYSYIEKLLKYISQEQPEVTVERFMEALHKINKSTFYLIADLVIEKASNVK